MPDFNVRSDSVNVEQIMEQIRARIREKRGVDYTEEQIRELAAVKLEKFLDPRGVRSDLLEQFRRSRAAQPEPAPPNYAFDDQTLYATHRAPIRWLRRLLRPILKLFFNPNPLIDALRIQSHLNTLAAEREASREAARRELLRLQYEVLHNLVVETTRLGIEVKNLKMRVESLAGRLEFNERRARALESVVVYKAPEEREPAPTVRAAAPPSAAPRHEPVAAGGTGQAPPGVPEGPGQRSRRRRRRRGRRAGGAIVSGQGQTPGAPAGPADDAAAHEAAGGHDETAETLEQAIAAESLPTEPLASTGSGQASTDSGPAPSTSSGPAPSTGSGPADE